MVEDNEMVERYMSDMKVWWIPQVPMKPFEVSISSVEEGVKILNVLADYDAFQFENKIKPDYANAGGLMVWELDDNEWVDWYDPETCEDDPEQYLLDRESEAAS